MIKTDLHVHTTYCDSKSTPEKTVLTAIEKGMETIGFSGHSYTFFDESYCMSKEGTESYKAEIEYLKNKYSDKINVLCGVEQDYYSIEPTDGYDYVIGSVHYLKIDGAFIPVDENADILKDAVKRHFDGDFYRLTGLYFDTVSDVAQKTECNIIGHFDLITKFNENCKLFDTNDERYINQWKRAADRLLKYDVPFEINTGAISRGYRTSPYPSPEIISYIKENGGRLVLSSDAHCSDTLMFEFDKFESLL